MKTIQQMTTNELLIEIAETAHEYWYSPFVEASAAAYKRLLDACHEAWDRDLPNFLNLLPWGFL